jgi:hypothetical protein
MAINIPIITSLEDTGIKNAKAAFGDFKDAVSKAEGGMGKFKAGSKVALDAVKANAATFAVAAGMPLLANLLLKQSEPFKTLHCPQANLRTLQGCTLRTRLAT